MKIIKIILASLVILAFGFFFNLEINSFPFKIVHDG
jgi:hypothetical protein